MGIAALVTALVLHVHAVQAQQQLPAQPVMPAQGTITSPFGQDGGQWHPGIDIGALRLLTAHTAVPALRARQQLLAQPVMPAEGTITSPFGHDGARWHPGIDIGVLRSLTVRAAVPGRVVLVGEVQGYEGYGNVVVVRSRGYQEIYAHLAAWRVHIGQSVVSGQHIATAGCTGWCTGTHLHFEVRKNGEAVSPFATLLRRFAVPPIVQQPRLLASAATKRQSARTLSFVAPRKPLW
jgi:murein DD-endopeptidase MepM/ murein hydrolase activator NlpD